MKLLKRIFNFWRENEDENLVAPTGESATFKLSYRDLTIGILELKDGVWQFEYTREFLGQDKIAMIANFPVDKVYKSADLWPFFASRIPGLGQPKVQEIIKKYNINKNNPVSLLKQFGRVTITNPFELTYS